MDLTFYYPELARWACADPTRVWLQTSMDQFMFKHLISAVAASIKQTAAWFLLLVWSCTLAGSAEAAFINHTGTMMQGQEMVWVSLRRTASLNVLLFRSSVQSLSYGESGTSQMCLSLSFWNTNRIVPTRAEIPSLAFWKSWTVIGRRSWWRFVCCWLINY